MAKYYQIKHDYSPILAYRGYLRWSRQELCDKLNDLLPRSERISLTTLLRVENLKRNVKWFTPDKHDAFISVFKSAGLKLKKNAIKVLDERYIPENI